MRLVFDLRSDFADERDGAKHVAIVAAGEYAAGAEPAGEEIERFGGFAVVGRAERVGMQAQALQPDVAVQRRFVLAERANGEHVMSLVWGDPRAIARAG